MFARWLQEQWSFRGGIDGGGKLSSFLFDELYANKFPRAPFDLLQHTRGNISKIGQIPFAVAQQTTDVHRRIRVQDGVRRFFFVQKKEIWHIAGTWCDLKSVFLKNKLIEFSL